MQTPGRLVARRDVAAELPAMFKEIKISPVRPELAEKLSDYAQQLRSLFGG